MSPTRVNYDFSQISLMCSENPIVDPATSAAVPGEDPNDPIEASQPKKKKRRTSGRRRQVINM